MNIFNTIKKIIPQLYIDKLKFQYHVPDMVWSLKNLYNNGFRPKQILDIGAFEGEWTIMAKKIFYDATYLMFEAQVSKQNILDKLKSEKVNYHIGLLGPESNSNSKFYINETVSSALPESVKVNQEYIVIPMYTVDDIIESKGISNPDFLKLDVQGYELEVLKGANRALSTAEVVLMEVSLLEINKGAPLIYDVMKFMDKHSFVCYDICSLVRRPLDNALWQTDLIFVKKTSNLLNSKSYK